jgi:hypothetical protein
MQCRQREIVVRRQEKQIIMDAQLSKQRIDRPQLYSRTPRSIPNFCGIDVILSDRFDKRERRESLHNVFVSSRSQETLQQFLQNQPSRYHDFSAAERCAQYSDL